MKQFQITLSRIILIDYYIMKKATGNSANFASLLKLNPRSRQEFFRCLKNNMGIYIRFNRSTGHFEYKDEAACREIINAFILIAKHCEMHCNINEII
jgi:hypothetical protein